jgi:hypothetical protein
MGGACRTNGEKRAAYRLLMGKPKRKRPLVRPRCRRLFDDEIDLVEKSGVAWTAVA